MASAIVCRTCNLARFPSLHGDGVDHGHGDLEVYHNANAPSRGRALASAGVAGNHWGSLVH